MSEPSTPLMRQYAAIKKEHPQTLLFFRLGDFYELFFEDAVLAARELQITLTSRNKEKGIAVPMCGVPYHAAEGYIARLIRKGFKVAICDQVEDPRVAKKLVRREVTRVVTPGTAADSSLSSEENNFLAAVANVGDRAGFAALDLSTGEFRATEFQGDLAGKRIEEELQQLRPKELLYASSAPLFEPAETCLAATQPDGRERPSVREQADQRGRMSSRTRCEFTCVDTPLDDWIFAPDHSIPLLENHFGVLSLEGFGLAGKLAASSAAGAILYYVRSTQRGKLDHVDRIGFYERQNCLVLDAVTVRNLELVEPLFAGTDAGITLFRCMDETVTPMGKRLLRAWLLRPSIDVGEIKARLDAVDVQVKDTVAREELRRALDGILDLERLLSRVTLEAANPRDVLALAASLGRIPNLKTALGRLAAAADVPQRLPDLQQRIDELADLRARIENTLVPEPPLTFSDGGVIATGIDQELDGLRDLSRNSKQYLAQIEQRERQRTGIASLKVKFNSVFGYYIEISKANLHLAPSDYDRKQTLVGAERFTTPELKEYESKILDAQEKIVEMERRIFAELRSTIAGEAKRIRQTALAVAEVDVLSSLAHTAALRNYCRPKFDESSDIEILEGRHPVIEQQELAGGTERFVPNDLFLNPTTHTILVLTGPNMGGKSTYLRQAALAVILAQMGSFVPARSARLGVVDRVFTRIGASDNLARGRSTFMVEMTETAAILHTATPRSLILLDEIGRGTATYDGLAIAWAAVEYLHARTRAKTLFATHYFELTELADHLSGVKNYHVSVKETGGGIIFLRKVEVGAADRSYGIEVAKLAGLPQEVILRAREVLLQHENAEQRLTDHLASDELQPARPAQLTIFTPLSHQVVDRLRDVDLNKLTPLEALNLLSELKKQLD
ncbi:MAG TPA: DNA mismatch repair protein MutS [Terriglobales bacterium]|nr:DNA mismatch repair protein MutS [Terriglobales bacterium]